MGELANAVESYGLWLDKDERGGEISFSVSARLSAAPKLQWSSGATPLRPMSRGLWVGAGLPQHPSGI